MFFNWKIMVVRKSWLLLGTCRFFVGNCRFSIGKQLLPVGKSWFWFESRGFAKLRKLIDLNKKMRNIAKTKNLKLSEYGLFKEGSDKAEYKLNNANKNKTIINVSIIIFVIILIITMVYVNKYRKN